MSKAPQVAEAGSKMQIELEKDHGLAEQYLAQADAANLYALYEKRCKQLESFGETLATMAEMYAGKGGPRAEHMRSTPDAVNAMEKVALAAIELAKAVAGKNSK